MPPQRRSALRIREPLALDATGTVLLAIAMLEFNVSETNAKLQAYLEGHYRDLAVAIERKPEGEHRLWRTIPERPLSIGSSSEPPY